MESPPAQPLRSRTTRLWVAVAGVVCALAWGRLLHVHVSTPSSPREIVFVGPDGPLDDRPYCHGAAVADGEAIWQTGTTRAGGEEMTHLLRFEPRLGRATATPITSHGYLRAFAAHPSGDRAFVVGDGVYVARGGSTPFVHVGAALVVRGFAWRGDLLEVVDSALIRSWNGKDWTKRALAALATGDAGVPDVAWVDGGRWLFLFHRAPSRTDAPGPVRVDLLVGSEEGPRQEGGSLELAPPHVHRLETGEISVDLQLDRSVGGVLGAGPCRPGDLLELTANGWVPPVLPATTSGAGVVECDYETVVVEQQPGAVGLRPILVLSASGRSSVRVRDRWLQLTTERYPSLTEVGGVSGPPLTHRFWLDPGFKVLPCNSGGYWVMGSLGEAFLHVDESLRRTDPLTFLERVGRLFREDRSKRNADFYLEYATYKRAAVPFVLLCFPLVVVPAAAVTRARGTREAESFARRLAAAYLAGCVLFFWPFFQLTGVLYS